MSGYGTDQELLLLEREGFGMDPAVVVLNVCVGNDALDNALPVYLYDGVTPKPYFSLEGATVSASTTTTSASAGPPGWPATCSNIRSRSTACCASRAARRARPSTTTTVNTGGPEPEGCWSAGRRR